MQRNKTCVKCGADDWRPNGKTYFRCNPCLIRQRSDRYSKRKSEIDAKNKAWVEDNRERVRLHKKRWRDANPEACREMGRRWREENPEKSRESVAFRRASLRNATPSWADREEMRKIHGIAKDKGLVVDHIVPLRSEHVCGLNTPDNLRCITSELNTYKGNRYWPDMARA